MVPVDGSPASDRAVLVATNLARELGCGLLFVHVLSADAPPDAARNAAETVLAVATARARQAAVAASSRTLEGDADVAILAASDTANARLIVIGTAPRFALERFLLGSVSEAVIARSRAPVVVVHPTTDVEALPPPTFEVLREI